MFIFKKKIYKLQFILQYFENFAIISRKISFQVSIKIFFLNFIDDCDAG